MEKYVYGIGAARERGARTALDLLRDELDRARSALMDGAHGSHDRPVLNRVRRLAGELL